MEKIITKGELVKALEAFDDGQPVVIRDGKKFAIKGLDAGESQYWCVFNCILAVYEQETHKEFPQDTPKAIYLDIFDDSDEAWEKRNKEDNGE